MPTRRKSRASDLEAAMHGHDAAAQVVKTRLSEPGMPQHLEQGLLVGVHADGFREIAVTVRVMRDQASQERQYLEGIGVVKRLQARRHRRRKLQDQQLTAGFQDTVDGLERRGLVSDVAQAETHGHAMKSVVLEGQTLG